MKVEWNKKYTTIAVYTVIVAAIVTMIVLFFLNLQFFGNAVAAFFTILMPFIVGFCIAYLLVRPCRLDRKSTRLNSSHITRSRMPSSA